MARRFFSRFSPERTRLELQLVWMCGHLNRVYLLDIREPTNIFFFTQ